MTGIPVSIKIDLQTGSLEITAPESALDRVFEKVQGLLPKLQVAVQGGHLVPDLPEVSTNETETPETKRTSQSREPIRRRAKPKTRQISETGNTVRLGTPFYKDFTPFNLGVGDQIEIEFSSLYKTAAPSKGKDKVLIACYIANKYLNKDRFTYDDIYQILRTAGESAPPKNLSAVTGPLSDENLIAKEADGLRVKIQGIDKVEKEILSDVNSG